MRTLNLDTRFQKKLASVLLSGSLFLVAENLAEAASVVVAAGGYHTCALTDANGIKCWGHNAYGQLGIGITKDRFAPVDIPSLTSGVITVKAGRYHTCAVTTVGGVKCWGNNAFGQLGDGTTTERPTPVDVSGLTTGVKDLALGRFHSCALMKAGGIRCWGHNDHGQLGDGTKIDKPTPVFAQLSGGAKAIIAGEYHTCAITKGGAAQCWGYNADGELGDGSLLDRNHPVQVVGLLSGVNLLAGGAFHSCAVIGVGKARCWGANSYGQLGDGTTQTRQTPTDVFQLSGVAGIDGGHYHTCAFTNAGVVKCWGLNLHGQLGDGTNITRKKPIVVSDLPAATARLSAGGQHTCARNGAGRIRCWGNNGDGQLGDDTGADQHSPVHVIHF